MDTIRTLLLLSLSLLWTPFTTAAQGLSGRDIIQRVKDRPDGENRSASITMVLTQKNGRQRERRLNSWAMDKGGVSKKIMLFTYPGDVKGTGFLTWDYDAPGREDDRWLYLPAMKKTRRISGKSSKSDYFMGSDFTYDDLGSRAVDEDSHTLLREEPLDGHDCWVVESIPQGKGDLYSKRVAWVRKDCAMIVRMEFYDSLGKLHRRFSASEIKQVQGFWTASRMEMENAQTGHRTLLTMENQQFNLSDINEELFTVNRLEKGL